MIAAHSGTKFWSRSARYPSDGEGRNKQDRLGTPPILPVRLTVKPPASKPTVAGLHHRKRIESTTEPAASCIVAIPGGGVMWSLDGDDLLFGAAVLFVIAVVLAII
jgi:hypothetical protein